MKMKTQWTVETVVNNKLQATHHSSLTKALNSLPRKLTGAQLFYVVIPDGKKFVIYKEEMET
jgi:hypothetical protein